MGRFNSKYDRQVCNSSTLELVAAYFGAAFEVSESEQESATLCARIQQTSEIFGYFGVPMGHQTPETQLQDS